MWIVGEYLTDESCSLLCKVKFCLSPGWAVHSYKSNIGAGRYHSLDCRQNSRRNSMKYEGTNGPNSEDDLKVASVKDI